MERYIFLLSNGFSFVNFDAILRKLQLFSDGRLEEKKSLHSATLSPVVLVAILGFLSTLKKTEDNVRDYSFKYTYKCMYNLGSVSFLETKNRESIRDATAEFQVKII